MTDKARNVLNLINKYNIFFDFNAKDISQVASETIYPATLTSMVKQGILKKVAVNPCLYRINKEYIENQQEEKLPNYIWEPLEIIDNKIVQSKDFDIPIEIASTGLMKFKTKQDIIVGQKVDFFDERIDNERERYYLWNIINNRTDLKFVIFTFNKNYQKWYPDDWEDGYKNVIINLLDS